MKEIMKKLKDIGLSEEESKVYVHLLGHGPHSISDLALKTGLYRHTIYDAIGMLIKKGLVTFQPIGKRKVCVAESPRKLLNLADSFVSDIRIAVKDLEKLASDRKDPAPVVRVIEGNESIRGVFADVVETMPRKGTFYRYTSEKDLDEVNRYLPKGYRMKRDAKKLERFVISNPISGKRKKLRLERWVKFVPPEFDAFEQNIIQLIYGKKVALIDLNAKMSMIIENAALADFQEKIFRLLYKKLD